jgi:AraC-like DNA-binding protein
MNCGQQSERGAVITVSFDTADAPAGRRIDYWQQAIGDTMAPLVGRHGGEFHASMVSGRVGPLRISEATTPAGVCGRTPRSIRHADRDLYQIDVIASGEVHVDHGGRQSRLTPGDLAFIDPARPVRYQTSTTTHVSILFPRGMLALRPDDVDRLTGQRVAGDRGTGALVSSLARQLPRHLDDWHSDEAVRLGTAVVDLLRVVSTGRLDPASRPEPERQEALLTRIYSYIDTHLGEPDLSPPTIAAAHHISLRYLYKLFASQERSVAGWVRQRRLECCRRDLLDPAQRHRPVSAIATSWGLPNSTHFSRMFKAAYGVSPVEFRAVMHASA